MDNEKINEIKILHELNFGLIAIGNCYGVSHQTIKNWLKKSSEYEAKRKFIKKKRKRHRQSLNDHVDPKLITHVLDFTRPISNGSIAKMHHSRKTLKPVVLGTIKNVKTGKIIYHIWKGKEENSFKVMFLVQKALDAGEKIKYLRSDRVLMKVAKALEKIGITLVVYPKDQKRPYNSRAEQTFVNIKKWVYCNLDLIMSLDNDRVMELVKGVCEVYYNHNPKLVLRVINELQHEKLILESTIKED